MKHHHERDTDRDAAASRNEEGRPRPHDHDHHDGHRRHRRGGRHGGRLFDYGELRILLLAMLAERPRHGYELIKAIEDRFGGSYSPSPGVIYPTLSWLDDMGYASIELEPGNRKSYRVTPEGEAFLAANRAAAQDLLTRGGAPGEGGRLPMPAPVMRAMEGLKLAMRLRLREGPLDAAAADSIAAALEAAAKAVERTR